MKELWQFELDRAAARDAWEPHGHSRHGEPFVDWALWLLEQGVHEESVQILAVLRAPLKAIRLPTLLFSMMRWI